MNRLLMQLYGELLEANWVRGTLRLTAGVSA